MAATIPSSSKSSFVDAFFSRGWMHLDGGLPPAAVSAFVADIAAHLANGTGHVEQTAATSGAWVSKATDSIQLDTPSTWPKRRERRVFEVAPSGHAEYWAALRRSAPLAAALNSIMGHGNWEIPLNEMRGDSEAKGSGGGGGGGTDIEGARQWYCPVTFPMRDGAPVSTSCSPVDRTALLGPAAPYIDALAAESTAAAAASPAATWQIISRRNVLGKGWHVDVGPGFGNDMPRTCAGDWRQGVVLLLLLSDCGPGEGGTALLSGSHTWVLRELARVEAAGGAPHTHESMNTWAVRLLRTATEDGRVVLRGQHVGACHTTTDTKGNGDDGDDGLGGRVSSPGESGGSSSSESDCGGCDGGINVADSFEEGNSCSFVHIISSGGGEKGDGCVRSCECSGQATPGVVPLLPGMLHATLENPLLGTPADPTAAACSTPCSTPASIPARHVSRAHPPTPPTSAEPPPRRAPLLYVEQITGRAGDIVLLHPLLLHSGTTVMGGRPRLLANGVAQYTAAAWGGVDRLNGQCPMLARGVAAVGGQ